MKPVCEACDRAAKNPNTGHITHGCDECSARAIARGQDVFYASEAGKVTPDLRDACRKVWGENWRNGLQLVNKWRERMKEQA